MDVVYLVRQGEKNEELRHSLRSLINLPHDTVWLVGHRPSWVDAASVRHVPTAQGQEVAAKHENTWRAWWAMAEARGISDDFVLMNDDFFIMRPLAEVTNEHAGPLLEWIDAMGNIRTTARMQHTIAALATRSRAMSLLAYETHSPMVLNRPALAEVMAFGQAYRNRTLSPPLCKRSLYGNYVGLPATYAPDQKVRDNKASAPSGAAIISTSDYTFNYGRVGQHLARVFAEPCTYERVRPVMPVR